MAEMRVPFVCSAETWRKRGENRKNGKNPCSSKKLLYPGHSMYGIYTYIGVVPGGSM